MATFQAVLDSDDDDSKVSEEEFYEAGDDMETEATATDQSPQSPVTQDENVPEPSSPDKFAKYDDSRPLTERKLMKFLKRPAKSSTMTSLEMCSTCTLSRLFTTSTLKTQLKTFMTTLWNSKLMLHSN